MEEKFALEIRLARFVCVCWKSCSRHSKIEVFFDLIKFVTIIGMKSYCKLDYCRTKLTGKLPKIDNNLIRFS